MLFVQLVEGLGQKPGEAAENSYLLFITEEGGEGGVLGMKKERGNEKTRALFPPFSAE